ncbi:MAG: hypothetical protein ACR2PF_10415 [Rhizobiaceae bacterium]
MLENILFFALGAMVTVLVTLMIAPAIWRRAVALTRQRIEASVPLSLDEIQGEKDQLRAAAAVEARKLEVTLEDERQKSAKQFIDLGKNRDKILKLEDEMTARAAQISELEAHTSALQSDLNTRENALQKVEAKLLATESKLEDTQDSLTDLQRRHEDLNDDFEAQKIELGTQQNRMETVHERERDLADRLKERTAEGFKIGSEMKAQEALIEREKSRLKRLEGKVAELQALNADLESRIERRDADIARLRRGTETGTDPETTVVADLRLSNLDDRTEQLSAENHFLKAELAKAQAAENADIRERINDLASQLAVFTASVEGPDSPVNKALEKDGPVSGSAEISLADRIRSMQRAAR